MLKKEKCSVTLLCLPSGLPPLECAVYVKHPVETKWLVGTSLYIIY